MVALNIVFGILVILGVLALLSWGIITDKPMAAALTRGSRRRGQRPRELSAS